MNTFQQTRRKPLIVGNIIFWMVMLAAIGLGGTHLNSCPLQPNIPIYLMVLGAASLITLSVTYVRDNLDRCALSSICVVFLYLFTFCWLIAGSVWIYLIFPLNSTPGRPYCHRTTYQFAFAVTTMMWISVLISLFIFVLLTSCKTEIARSWLIPSRYAFYGATNEGLAADITYKLKVRHDKV
ncbi:transmembrane protein 272-like isoform X2 [Antennarius striatus]|uniref:transmembrane protein 272-like isoform X2 n=1 Tax=Antennarius striatus TaxID=241820 RepID=UPI0035B19268